MHYPHVAIVDSNSGENFALLLFMFVPHDGVRTSVKLIAPKSKRQASEQKPTVVLFAI